MKKLIPILLFLCSFSAKGQNLVFNGSFEQYTSCPVGAALFGTRCVGWTTYTLTSPDYFSTCVTTTSTGVPQNTFGYQYPADGQSYAGLVAYNKSTTFREYLKTTIPSLTIGQQYAVSMSVSMANTYSKFGLDGLGVYFFQNGPATIANSNPVILTPQVSFKSYGPITDTQNWVRVTAVFTADSNYTNMVIGCFEDPVNMTLVPNNVTGYSYYYVDSVVLQTSKYLYLNFQDSLLCGGDTIYAPFVSSGNTYVSGNVFTLQLSNASGSFSSPVAIGSLTGTGISGTIKGVIPTPIAAGTGYRLRIVSSNIADTSNLNTYPLSIGPGPIGKPLAGSNTPVCAGRDILLTATTTTPGVTYSWKGPNSFTSLQQNPIISNPLLTAAGDYIVTAKLFGCTAKDTETVVIKEMPAPVIASSNSPICQNMTLNLAATNNIAGVTYSWSGPNSFSSTLQNPLVANAQPTASGDYIVTVDLNGCNVKDTVSVVVQPTPGNINATSNAPLCEGQTLNLDVTSNQTGVTHSWTGPNSFTSAIANPSILNATTGISGNYIVTLDLNGCTGKDTVNVVVHPIPAAPSAGSNTPVCFGNNIHLSATSGIPGTIYNWYGPNSYTSTLQNPVINGANTSMSGIYNLTATVNGCTSPATPTTVNILYFPSSIALYAIPNDTICVGGSIQLVGVPSNGGTAPQYKWLKNGNVINGATSISYTTSALMTGDKFNVILTPDNSCPDPDTSAAMEITVLPYVTPSVSITASPGTLISPWQTITFTATPVNGGKNPTYQWKRNGQNIVGAVNDVWGAYTLSNNDTISVEMFSSELCPSPASASSNKIIVAVKTGVDDVASGKDLSLYPNPNNGTFQLTGYLGKVGKVDMEIQNAIGQIVYKKAIATVNGRLDNTINLQESNGIYLLKIQAKGIREVIRFVISK